MRANACTRIPKWMLLFFLVPVLSLAGVDNEKVYDRVELAVDARKEVENDLLTAVLYAQREGEDAARLASEVNRSLEWALQQARAVPAVKVQTLEYRTSPIYNKQTLSGWRVRQSLRLESRDGTVLSELVGRLQQRLAVQSIAYAISPERRRKAEDLLIEDALKAFRRRADLIAGQLGRPGYRLVRMRVESDGSTPRPRYQAAAMNVRQATTAPVLEPGTRTVQVRVSGSVELKVE